MHEVFSGVSGRDLIAGLWWDCWKESVGAAEAEGRGKGQGERLANPCEWPWQHWGDLFLPINYPGAAPSPAPPLASPVPSSRSSSGHRQPGRADPPEFSVLIRHRGEDLDQWALGQRNNPRLVTYLTLRGLKTVGRGVQSVLMLRMLRMLVWYPGKQDLICLSRNHQRWWGWAWRSLPTSTHSVFLLFAAAGHLQRHFKPLKASCGYV